MFRRACLSKVLKVSKLVSSGVSSVIPRVYNANSVCNFSTGEVKCSFPPDVSFYRRRQPSQQVHLNSPSGRSQFAEALAQNTMEQYFPLSENFMTQSDPSFCSLTTLAMCLNAMNVDPTTSVWRHPWRWYHEDILCGCLNRKPVFSDGITFAQFISLAKCHGLIPSSYFAQENDIDAFRQQIKELSLVSSMVKDGHACDSNSGILSGQEHLPEPEVHEPHILYTYQDYNTNIEESLDSEGKDIRGGLKACMAVSFDRKAIGQTGTGHMSPIAGYHEEKDMVLILDVARFKYPPYWIKLQDLWDAMLPHDPLTNKSRGWAVLKVGGKRCCAITDAK